MSFGDTGQNRASANRERLTEPAVVFEDQMYPGEWRVQWSHDTGEIEVTVFSGPNSRQRAIHYAERQYGVFEEAKFDPL